MMLFIIILSMHFAIQPIQLYFDVNGTLIWDDPAGGKTIQEGIESALSKAKGHNEALEAQKLSRFAKNQLVQQWINNENLVSLVQETLEQTLSPGEHSTPHGTIFPSFVHLLNQLDEKAINYNLCLRTFGHDGERLAKMIEHIRPKAKFQFAYFIGEHKIQVDQIVIEGIGNITDFIHQTPFLVLKDHYLPWKDNDECWLFGKPYYFDHGDRISFFFDDNANSKSLESRNDIVCPVNAKGEKVHPYYLYNKNIFPVVTFLAGTKVDYYSNLVFSQY